jgi:signal peptidase I
VTALTAMLGSRVFDMPCGSMLPTILVSEMVRVELTAYHGRLPNRGDIAVFKLPRDPSVDYLKRVVGLPSDRVQMIRGQLYINGQQVDRQAAGDYVTDGDGPKMLLHRYVETFPGGDQHYILKASDDQPLDNTQEYTVPEGYVFVMGDNRDNSLDSRVLNAVGFIPLANLEGRAVTITWSSDASRVGIALH